MIEAKEIGQGHQWYFGVGESHVLRHRVGHPKTRDGNGRVVPHRDRFPAPLARLGALDTPAPLILCAILFIVFLFVTFDRSDPRVSSKEVRAFAAGFRIEDLMPCEKYVDPAAYSRRSLTWCRNRAEAEDDNSGTVGFLLSLSLPKNHRKVFATGV